MAQAKDTWTAPDVLEGMRTTAAKRTQVFKNKNNESYETVKRRLQTKLNLLIRGDVDFSSEAMAWADFDPQKDAWARLKTSFLILKKYWKFQASDMLNTQAYWEEVLQMEEGFYPDWIVDLLESQPNKKMELKLKRFSQQDPKPKGLLGPECRRVWEHASRYGYASGRTHQPN